MDPEEIQKKREEAERKARRGEIDPMQEFAFSVIAQVKTDCKVPRSLPPAFALKDFCAPRKKRTGNRKRTEVVFSF